MADPQVSMAHMDINVDTFDQKSSALKVWRVPQEWDQIGVVWL